MITLLALAAALTIGPALLAGHYFNRWGAATDFQTAAEQVQKFPEEFGRWKTEREGEPLSDFVCQELGVAGYVSRQFVNRDNGASVNLLLMVGQSGPLLRHPPNICYANRANRQVGDMTKFKVETPEANSEFTAIEYEPPNSVMNDRFLVAYAMSVGTEWSVPRHPRLEFGGSPKLYKVQLLSPLSSSKDRAKGISTLQQFATDFCAAFQQLVQTDSKSANRSSDIGHSVP
jgi:hypothetical protein